MAIQFCTKASTLAVLQGQLATASILPLVILTKAEWLSDPQKCISTVKSKLGLSSLIVRSSSVNEDNYHSSNAGRFLSLIDVNESNFQQSIDQVIASYGNSTNDEEVLIQPMLRNVILSGVAFSHDPSTNAPYRVINWFDGEDTSFITSGKGGRTWQQSESVSTPESAPEGISLVINLLAELLVLFEQQALDCEFAITVNSDNQQQLWLLQARPLILSQPVITNEIQRKSLQNIYNKVSNSMYKHPFLKGDKTVFGVMPDWNPAEIIGIRPKTLALTLYGELITNSIWAYQRHNYGYRNLRSFPLMPNFCGLPYIDLRVSFNSFIPADIDDSVAKRLVEHYIGQLVASPELHDKVEFEIIFSCYTLDLPERLKSLNAFGFSDAEQKALAGSLRKLTNNIIHPINGLWKKDAEKLDKLLARREELLNAKIEPLDRIYWLIEDAKRYGTLPFAGLARASFVAVQMLRSLVTVGIFTENDYDAFLASVSTVSAQLAFDRATLDKTTFLSRYGHLRPGTYDILSLRYDEKPELYFDWEQRKEIPASSTPFSLTLIQLKAVKELLITHGLTPDPVGLFDFIQAAIELRELAKFHFTKNLSDVLSLVADYGQQLSISREDMAFCDIAVFKELYISSVDPKKLILNSITLGKVQHSEAKSISLPPLITTAEDIWAFEWPQASPNFITQQHVTANVVNSDNKDDITGAIVCIPNADPGFDWLFSYPIAGLITAWGGVNSHMAIRASELGLPAVIGAGEILYQEWSKARCLHIDCSGRRVEVLE